ncbi:MAG TPA: tRNA dihydrouridine(20/20a) synthase DusA [Steroidobacteraceae bacterium]|nr:tRNA dihydrouridine(20/20a) synthase DusA [Steroidobacteraceae bacterium]
MENATKQGISVEKSSPTLDRRISVAPMMDWTDRHCRFFLRGFAPDTLLYTEMITTGAVLRGDREKLLRFDPEEHPVALQLGGSEPAALAESARIGAAMGYDEINLNCGCPSDRVHSGAFGACLMLKPRLVAECVHAMRDAVQIPVTVKLRIGVVDAHEFGGAGESRRESARAAAARFAEAERAALEEFVDGIVAAGCDAVIVHARKAVLGAWSPADNREIPPLRYDVVQDLRQRIAPLPVVLNGGLRTRDQVVKELQWADGAMLGREAYHRPMLLAEVSKALGGELPSRMALLERMTRYARRETARGERLAWIARHMLGLYAGMPGAKEFRRRLSEGARVADASPDLLLAAGEACEKLNAAAA